MWSSFGRGTEGCFQRSKLLLGQISLVGASEVEFITVLLCLHGAEDGIELGQLYLSDARELVVDLLLLELQLLLIGQVLPLAATADTEMLTEGYRAYLTIFYNTHHLALGERMFLTTNLYVADVTRNAERYKHHHIIPVEQALPFGGNGLYLDTLKEW